MRIFVHTIDEATRTAWESVHYIVRFKAEDNPVVGDILSVNYDGECIELARVTGIESGLFKRPQGTDWKEVMIISFEPIEEVS